MVIFIILALVIVAVVLIFFLLNSNFGFFSGEDLTPQRFFSECLEPEIQPSVGFLAKQGGYKNPEGYATYQGEQIKYLCYTDDYYETCAIQQPLTKRHFEKELGDILTGKGNQCMNEFLRVAQERGYTVDSEGFKVESSLIPGKIIVALHTPLTLTKNDNSQRFEKVVIEKESEIYDLLFVAQSIVDSEAKLGDSAIELYMQYYPDLEIRKIKLSDGTKIYKLSNVVTGEVYQFSSRSLAWPAGYGLEGGNL